VERSEQIADLVTALAKAQAEFTFASKDSNNPAFGSKYADLAANIIAVRPALSKHGIALMQFDASDVERQTASVTTALHLGEQWISITVEAPAIGNKGFNVQSLGACWTYLRRYTLQALCGLASDDDDGNSLAVENKPVFKKSQGVPATLKDARAGGPEELITQDEGQNIKDELKRTQRKAAELYEFIEQKVGTPIPASKYLAITQWFKTPIMPQAVREVFAALDWTEDEQVKFCESKSHDWVSIKTQLEAMLDSTNAQEA
jgi:hypothetical protein